jgi:hypothetical protein
MGMKKIMNLTYLAAALLGVGMVSSCSDSSIEAEDLTHGGETANVYANITMTVQDNTSSGTRAEEASSSETTTNSDTSDNLEGEIKEQGSVDEATVKTLTIYAFEDAEEASNRKLVEKVVVNSAYVSYDATSNYSYNASAIFNNLKTGENNNPKTYRLYAIANTDGYTVGEVKTVSDAGSSGQATTEAEFLENFKITSSSANGWIDANSGVRLPMANRAFVSSTNSNADIPYVLLKVEANNSQTNPATADIELERLVAKYNLKVEISKTTEGEGGTKNTTISRNTDLEIGETGVAYANIEINGYYPFNLSKNSYGIRHRSTYTVGKENPWSDFTYCDLDNLLISSTTTSGTDDGASSTTTSNWNGKTWTAADYVVDPYTKTKKVPSTIITPEAAGNTYGLGNSMRTENKDFTDITDTESHLLGYSFENTTTADAQYMEYSTGLMFRAIIEPKKDYTDASLTAEGADKSSAYYFNYRFYKDIKSLYAYESNSNILPEDVKKIIPQEPKATSVKVYIYNNESTSKSTSFSRSI